MLGKCGFVMELVLMAIMSCTGVFRHAETGMADGDKWTGLVASQWFNNGWKLKFFVTNFFFQVWSNNE